MRNGLSKEERERRAASLISAVPNRVPAPQPHSQSQVGCRSCIIKRREKLKPVITTDLRVTTVRRASGKKLHTGNLVARPFHFCYSNNLEVNMVSYLVLYSDDVW